MCLSRSWDEMIKLMQTLYQEEYRPSRRDIEKSERKAQYMVRQRARETLDPLLLCQLDREREERSAEALRQDAATTESLSEHRDREEAT